MKNMMILFVISFVIFSVSGFVDDAFAWHDAGKPMWGITNNSFLCDDSLNDIKHELFSPCVEARKAAKSWNDVKDSSWTLTYTSGDQASIHLIGKTLKAKRALAQATGYGENGKISSAVIKFSLIKPFTDVSHRNSNVNYHDFESVIFHEFGHLQWVGHSKLNWDSAMEPELSPDTIRDKPEKHDIDVLKARYPK